MRLERMTEARELVDMRAEERRQRAVARQQAAQAALAASLVPRLFGDGGLMQTPLPVVSPSPPIAPPAAAAATGLFAGQVAPLDGALADVLRLRGSLFARPGNDDDDE